MSYRGLWPQPPGIQAHKTPACSVYSACGKEKSLVFLSSHLQLNLAYTGPTEIAAHTQTATFKATNALKQKIPKMNAAPATPTHTQDS